MRTPKKSNGPSQNSALDSNGLLGLATLKRTLERDFFADASLDICSLKDGKVDLVIHLDCNFGLTESLFHLNNGNWGSFHRSTSEDVKTSPFQAMLYQLESENNVIVDIKEISIHLKDTSIIISRLPNCHIQDNLENILNAVSGSFVHFTKGLSKMPYEIFVPIYEETKTNFRKSENESSWKPDYLEFWGLYFEGEDDLQVYDVKNKVIIEESDFFLLNYWE